ncbi:hypothetical protein [Actinoplanes regularis]|uniref:hypothetical protein n=1 Tax=Actinoplanes regularis TaxID=52697 RepID=UPI0024A51BEC|nr:hypothetical protein [Actinoplanes regularis]GLW32366.1 hypothetical protein Areg01_53050 [Actinoplanes regularis]
MVDARIETGEQGWRYFSGLHRLLLRLAGQVPGDWLTDMRRMLAGGDLVLLPDTVAGSAVEFGVPLTNGEVALLREMTRAFLDEDPMALDLVTLTEETPLPRYRFFPVPAEVLATDADRIPPRMDFTGRPGESLWELPPVLAPLNDLATRLTDLADRSPIIWLREEDDVRSVARTWRFPPDGPLDGGVRVVLVEVSPYAPAWDRAHEASRALAGRGDDTAEVEVYWAGEELPPYHRAALDGAALLWRPGER